MAEADAKLQECSFLPILAEIYTNVGQMLATRKTAGHKQLTGDLTPGNRWDGSLPGKIPLHTGGLALPISVFKAKN